MRSAFDQILSAIPVLTGFMRKRDAIVENSDWFVNAENSHAKRRSRLFENFRNRMMRNVVEIKMSSCVAGVRYDVENIGCNT